MKILLVHNKYGKFSGEEAAVESLQHILEDNNHSVINYFRSSKEIEEMNFGKFQAFFSGFINFKSIKEITSLINNERPDVIHIHNLFPFISPAILPEIKKLKVPIVMTVHNYRLLCPNGLFRSKNAICQKCISGAKELNCILKNCEDDIFKSVGYALRNLWARKKEYFMSSVDTFLCLTEFQKNILVSNGYSAEKIRVIPNYYGGLLTKGDNNVHTEKDYVAFAGRITIEKGIELIIDAALSLTHIEFHLAGSFDASISRKLPQNIKLRGMLNSDELKMFYKNAKFLIMPSIWYEGMPMVLLEAMAHQLPVIAPKMSGFKEVIKSNYNGLLFKPLDSESFISNIELLWNNNDLIKKLGSNALKSIEEKYNSDEYYRKLEDAYSNLINFKSKDLLNISAEATRQKKILIIHNKYGIYSGEESVVDFQVDSLKRNNFEVVTYFRGSYEIKKMKLGKVRAFFSGLYNERAVKSVKKIIESENPDIVHIHNLFPLISPAVLNIIKEKEIPIVMTVHNYRLLCPNGLFYNKGLICEKCTVGVKELNCIIGNCEGQLFKSIGYALRNFWARKRKYYLSNVDTFLCLTEFQKSKLITNGFSSEKIEVLPNSYNGDFDDHVKNEIGHYVAFVGRISPEKGIDLLLKAAKELPEIKFELAGHVTKEYEGTLNIPKNVILRGALNEEELKLFYKNARFLVFSSICYEGFPMVLPEAMAYGLPIVAPKLGGIPEIARDKVNGLHFKASDEKSLIESINILWNDDKLVMEYGKNSYLMGKKNYNSKKYVESLIHTYERFWNN